MPCGFEACKFDLFIPRARSLNDENGKPPAHWPDDHRSPDMGHPFDISGLATGFALPPRLNMEVELADARQPANDAGLGKGPNIHKSTFRRRSSVAQ